MQSNNTLAQTSVYALDTPFSNNRPNERLIDPPVLNGRVPVSPDVTFHPYKFADTDNSPGASSTQLSHIQQSTLLSRTFFLPQNIKILQNALRRRVYDRTNQVIQEQSVEQLQIVMRSVFLQYSTNRTDNASIITEQVQQLNEHVLNYCVPKVVSNLKQYTQYRKDISQMPVPMEYGLCTSVAGSKSYKQAPFI
jgi:hypothetical protein